MTNTKPSAEDTGVTYRLVAPVELTEPDQRYESELVADLGESKVCKEIEAGIDRMPAGLRPASMYAVWDFPEARPKLREAHEAARSERPARLLVHVGQGVLLQLAPRHALDLLVKES
jgi:hypothetical protein